MYQHSHAENMKALKWLDQYFEYVVIVIFTTLMLFVLFAQVVMRFVFKGNLAWTEEIAIYSMVWLSYFAVSLGVRRRAHLKVEIITVFLKPKAKIIFDMISLVFFFVFTCIVLYFSFEITMDIFERGQVTPVLMIPKGLCYIGAPLGFLCTLFRIIQDFIKLVHEFKELGNNETMITQNNEIDEGREK